jgi:hypothetical protein
MKMKLITPAQYVEVFLNHFAQETVEQIIPYIIERIMFIIKNDLAQ